MSGNADDPINILDDLPEDDDDDDDLQGLDEFMDAFDDNDDELDDDGFDDDDDELNDEFNNQIAAQGQGQPAPQPGDRKRRRLTQAKEVVIARRNRLAELHRPTVEAGHEEDDLLFKNPVNSKRRLHRGKLRTKENLPYDMFKNSHMAGRDKVKNYVLQDLGVFLQGQVDEEQFQKYLDIASFNNEDFWDNCSTFYKEDLLGVEEDPYDLKEICRVIKSRKPVPGGEDALPIWRNISNWYNLARHLGRLLRFVNKANPETNVKPLPDGSNLEAQALRLSWALHRAWIRLLHYRSLNVGDTDPGVRQLKQILILSIGFLDLEARLIKTAQKSEHPKFEILKTIYDEVREASVGFINASFGDTPEYLDHRQKLSEEHGDDAPELQNNTRHDKSTYNWSTAAIIQRLYDEHFGKLSEFGLLLEVLLNRANNFERKMDIEHVEDFLINKRIIVDDEEWIVAGILDGVERDEVDHRIRNLPKRPVSEKLYADVVEPAVEQIAITNRNRRNYLLLRDWAKKRPWQQLYWLVDTTPGSERAGWTAHIQKFYQIMQELADYDGATLGYRTADAPSRRANIWAGLFPIHPIATEDINQDILGKDFEQLCITCGNDWEPGTTMVKLHCNHFHHVLCYLRWIDKPGTYRYTCTKCREADTLLHKKVDIVPEGVDVWDNVQVTDPAQAAKYPDIPTQEEGTQTEEDAREDAINPAIPSDYWLFENQKLQLSRVWGQTEDTFRQPRSVQVEMANMRQNRRAWDKGYRTNLEKHGIGLHDDFDPSVSSLEPAEGEWQTIDGKLKYVKFKAPPGPASGPASGSGSW